MSHIKTVVEKLQIEDGEPTDEGTEELYYLLHWGLELNYMMDQPTAETVAICQHIKTGRIQTFLPRSIRVIGIETK